MAQFGVEGSRFHVQEAEPGEKSRWGWLTGEKGKKAVQQPAATPIEQPAQAVPPADPETWEKVAQQRDAGTGAWSKLRERNATGASDFRYKTSLPPSGHLEPEPSKKK